MFLSNISKEAWEHCRNTWYLSLWESVLCFAWIMHYLARVSFTGALEQVLEEAVKLSVCARQYICYQMGFCGLETSVFTKVLEWIVRCNEVEIRCLAIALCEGGAGLLCWWQQISGFHRNTKAEKTYKVIQTNHLIFSPTNSTLI